MPTVQRNKVRLQQLEKLEHLNKRSASGPHKTSMIKWISQCAQNKRNSSTISQLKSSHHKIVNVNRDYMLIINECLMFTARQNVARRAHEVSRSDHCAISGFNRGNFLELLHLLSRDMAVLNAEGRNWKGIHNGRSLAAGYYVRFYAP